MISQRWLRPLRFILPWCLLGWISASQIYFLWMGKEKPIPFTAALLWQLPPWGAWALATPLIAWLLRRFPLRLDRQALPATLLCACAHLALAVATSILYVFTSVLTGRLVEAPYYQKEPLLRLTAMLLGKTADTDLVVYLATALVCHAVALQRKYREREVAAAQLAERLAQAQLAALKMQLHPHFLFNTLHTVGVLIRKQEPAAALRVLSGLGDLLRLALDDDGRQQVALREEQAFLLRYLDLERVRFQDRLTVDWDVPPALLGAQVPNLILQPLVENALRHGLAPKAAPGHLRISAAAAEGRLTLTVQDDGVGPRKGWQAGTGLRNVRERLQRLYPDDHVFAIEPLAQGTRALIEIPLHRAGHA
jgi:hypothetical protein